MSPQSSHRPIIGILTADSTPFIGGIGRHVETLATGLRAAGDDVRILDLRSLPTFRFGRNIGTSLCMGRAVRRWIAENDIDVLNVHCGPGGVLPWNPVWNGVPVVCTANHTYLQQSRMPNQRWKRLLVPWERRGYALANRVVCISSDTRQVLINEYRLSPQAVSVIPCGFSLQPWINADAQEHARRRFACVFVGRPQTRKGWDVLQQAWRGIRIRCPQAQLSVVGWSEKPRDGMEFFGRLDDTALQSLVGSVRVLLAPSRMEGFGLAAAEAIAAATPVVGFDVAGLRTTVQHGVTGLLCRQDGEAFVQAVACLLNDDVRWRELHAGCRANRSLFDAHREVMAYRQLFAAVYSRP